MEERKAGIAFRDVNKMTCFLVWVQLISKLCYLHAQKPRPGLARGKDQPFTQVMTLGPPTETCPLSH